MWHDDLNSHLHELAVKIDAPFDLIAPRVRQLLEASVEGELEDRLNACFWLEPYEVFPQDVLLGAPTMQEYEDFVKDVAVELGKPERYKPLEERQQTNVTQLTLEQLLESLGE